MPFIQRYVCSVSFVGFWNWALSDFSGVGGELRLVKMESHNPTAWKPLSSPRGTTVGGVLGGRRGCIVAWRAVLSARAARMDIWPVWAPWGSCGHLSSRDVTFSMSQLVQGQEAQDSGSPAVPRYLASPHSLPSPGQGGRNRTISTSSSHQLFLLKTLKASSLDLLKD